MATSTPGVMTYSEWALRQDPNGGTSELVNLLSQNNPMLSDMLARECQSGNAYEFTQVVKLPVPVRRSYNQGVTPTQGAVAKQVQTAIEYADTVQIDNSLARLNGNLAALRYEEVQLHMQALGQLVASDLFYSNNLADPTSFTGLANIYSTVSTSTSQIANNVIDGGGTGSTNSSMWLIGWGPKQIHTIFPNGMPAGLQHMDQGLQNAYDTDGKKYLAWQDWLSWNIGLAIHDWRYGVRTANIDVTLFGGASAANLIGALTAMAQKPPVIPAGAGPVQTSDSPDVVMPSRNAIYVNRTVYLALDLQAQNKTNVLLQMREWEGHVILAYRGIPIQPSDALVNTETRVV